MTPYKITKPGIQLIGINGKAGSGKDTIATYIHEHYLNCWGEAFATPLKEAGAAAFGIPLDRFNDPEIKELPDPFWKVSPRKIAQFLGTEMFRTYISQLVPQLVPQSFWVARLCGKINGEITEVIYEAGETIVITDVRFRNEAEFILDNGGMLIILDRPGADGNVGIAGHQSELGFDPPEHTEIFYITNDGTLEELYDQVNKALDQSQLDFYKSNVSTDIPE